MELEQGGTHLSKELDHVSRRYTQFYSIHVLAYLSWLLGDSHGILRIKIQKNTD